MFEKNLLETLSDPVATIFVMITVKILSAHGTDEEYLDKEEHNYIKVRSLTALRHSIQPGSKCTSAADIRLH